MKAQAWAFLVCQDMLQHRKQEFCSLYGCTHMPKLPQKALPSASGCSGFAMELVQDYF
jgi:hypothetical protein